MRLSPRPFGSRSGGRLSVICSALRPPPGAIRSVRDTTPRAQPFQYVPVFCTVLPPREEDAAYLEVTAMLLETVFAPFITERPICVMARGVLERLLDADRVDTLFEYTATQQYTRE